MSRRALVLTLTGVALMAALAPAKGAIRSAPPASVTESPGSTPDRPASTRPAPAAKPSAKRRLSRSGLKRQLSQALRSAGGSSGAYVWDLDASRRPLLFARRGRSGRIPASNQKLFTTAAMLDRFGPDGRLRTAAYARGKRWGARDRVLKGDLVMVGDGDPALGTRQFARSHGLPVTPVGKLARKVKAAGIGRITGRVVADDSIFDRRRGVAASGWSAGPYLSPLSGLSFNSGFDGSRYARKPEFRAARQLRRSLRGQGVVVRRKGIGRADLKRPRLERGPLAAVESPTVGTLIAETNKPSNNFYAEMLLKRVGARPGARGTTSRGAHRVEAFARSVGSGVTVSDGSGLGRGNRVTPRQVVRLLVAMQGPGMHGSAFRGSLPLAGHEGTVASRMRGTAAHGRCRAKTGTLSGVSALSGYCDAGRGHTVAFSILMNSVGNVYAARLAQDRMAAAIASYRR